MDILVDYTGTGKDFPSLPFPLRPIAVGEGATKSIFLYKKTCSLSNPTTWTTKINQKYANKKHIYMDPVQGVDKISSKTLHFKRVSW